MGMHFRVSYDSIPGNPAKPNEDRAGWDGQRSFWVIDGATGIGDIESYLGQKNQTDAGWLAQRLHEVFKERAAYWKDNHFGLLEETRIRLRDEFLSQAVVQPEASYAWPGAALSILHWGDEMITLTSLGDCPSIMRGIDGETVYHQGDRNLIALDQEIPNLIAKYSDASGKPKVVRDPEILPHIRRGRLLANADVPGGYSSFTLDKPILPHLANRICYPSARVSEFLLMSDGFGALVDDYKLFSPVGLLEALKKEGIPNMLRDLRDVEEADAQCVLYPRLKKGDDASVLRLVPVFG